MRNYRYMRKFAVNNIYLGVLGLWAVWSAGDFKVYPLKQQNTLQINALSSWQSHPSWSGLRRPPLPSILNVPLHRLNMTYFHFKKQSRWPKNSRKKLRAGWSVHLVFRIHGHTLTKLIKRKYVNRFCKISCFAPTLAQKMLTLRLYRDDVDRCIARHLKPTL